MKFLKDPVSIRVRQPPNRDEEDRDIKNTIYPAVRHVPPGILQDKNPADKAEDRGG
jgi:hypothetical protein